jgi:phosphoribosyl 1,2-cyclic phosphate phosphodiesterase
MRSGYEKCPKGVCIAARAESRHARTRSSILVEYDNRAVLIDVSADFRQQALRESVSAIHAILITHTHADHIMGIPDIRSYTVDASMPLYGSAQSVHEIQSIFKYIFDPATFVGGGIPKLTCIPVNQRFPLFGKTVTPIPVAHGTMSGCYGYRIGDLAYIPDLKSIGDSEKALLFNLDCLIIDCLRETRPHSTHIILPESLTLARELKPRQCYFVHLSHDIHFIDDAKHLDSWMAFAYDGLRLDI